MLKIDLRFRRVEYSHFTFSNIISNITKITKYYVLESKFSVEVKYLQIDFGQDEKIYQTIEEFLKDMNIGVLINNVGTTGHAPECFLDVSTLSESIASIMRINIISVLKVSSDSVRSS